MVNEEEKCVQISKRRITHIFRMKFRILVTVVFYLSKKNLDKNYNLTITRI